MPKSTTTRTTSQTVRIAGVRTRIVTKNGKVTAKAAPVLEWELQAEQCRRLRRMPGVLFVGGMEAGKRGPRAQVQALATGLTAGHPDLTIFLPGGRTYFIENKVGNGRLSPAQMDRHEKLRKAGFIVEVIRATSKDEAGDKIEATVLGWLSANDNDYIANDTYGT